MGVKYTKLAAYRKKRDFSKTREPGADEEVAPGADASESYTYAFVVQKHAASTLHYDFRLEIDGVLKSWAVPKGPSLDPKDKRLAVATEDHPLAYKDFAGVIPEGQYGAGTVEIWDSGTYTNVRAPLAMQKTWEEGRITVNLCGKKLHGNYALVKIKQPRVKTSGEPWLLLKVKDTDKS